MGSLSMRKVSSTLSLKMSHCDIFLTVAFKSLALRIVKNNGHPKGYPLLAEDKGFEPSRRVSDLLP